MEKRIGRRIKRRLTCEFFNDTSSHRGIILDLSPSGIFIRTNAVLSPGTEIDIFLAASVAAPAMTLRGIVVRRRSVPATLTTLLQPGLGVKILDAPREYGLLTVDCELDEAIETDSASVQTPSADRQQAAQQPPTTHHSGVEREAAESAAQPPPREKNSEESSTAENAQKKRSKAARIAARADPRREAGPSKPVSKPKRPPIAVLVGGSVLGEVAGILREMGVETIECGPYDPQLAALDDARLLVVSAEVAMSDPIPVDTDMLVGVAVCGDISETMRSQIRQQGFRYLLRPHVHPEALRLLLRYAVYAERDRRGRVRHPVGCEVGWRVGWKRCHGRLLDISQGGCCLLVENPPKIGARITIKIPAQTVGGQALKLRGKVVRSTPNSTHRGIDQTALGVILDDITPAARKVVDDLCDRWSESPPMLSPGERLQFSSPERESRDEMSLEADPRADDSQSFANSSAESKPEGSTSSESQAPPVFAVNRVTPRGVFEQEIVQVDEAARVVQALLGRDLSVNGIRVARQLGLSLGKKLRLALFDTSQKKPLILSAEVARDDGGSGLFLRFVDPSPEAVTCIEEIIARLPAVESIDPHGDARVVPASVVSNRP